jgi:hypothetical protein
MSDAHCQVHGIKSCTICMPAIRGRIADILGLETSPHGEPHYLLTYDEEGTVLEGVDFSNEVEELAQLYERGFTLYDPAKALRARESQ